MMMGPGQFVMNIFIPSVSFVQHSIRSEITSLFYNSLQYYDHI